MSAIDKWGIAGLCLILVFVLWKRDERRETVRDAERKELENERLELQKKQLELLETNNNKLVDLTERSLKVQSNSTIAINELKSSLKEMRCAAHNSPKQ